MKIQQRPGFAPGIAPAFRPAPNFLRMHVEEGGGLGERQRAQGRRDCNAI